MCDENRIPRTQMSLQKTWPLCLRFFSVSRSLVFSLTTAFRLFLWMISLLTFYCWSKRVGEEFEQEFAKEFEGRRQQPIPVQEREFGRRGALDESSNRRIDSKGQWKEEGRRPLFRSCLFSKVWVLKRLSNQWRPSIALLDWGIRSVGGPFDWVVIFVDYCVVVLLRSDFFLIITTLRHIRVTLIGLDFLTQRWREGDQEKYDNVLLFHFWRLEVKKSFVWIISSCSDDTQDMNSYLSVTLKEDLFDTWKEKRLFSDLLW